MNLKKNLRIGVVMIIALVGLAMLSGVPTADAATKKLKVAFALLWTIDDQGWTTAHYHGIEYLKAKLGDQIEISYTEKVLAADAERVFRNYAQQGYDIIFGTTFEHMDPMLNVAKDYPDIVFEHCSGFKTAANMGNYFGRMYQARYLSGMVAGAMTKSNIIGYAAAFPIPEVIRGINAFTLGVQSVNPQAEVRVVWTQTWFDPGIERDAADSLLDVGADVLAMHQDAPATLQAAEARGAFVIGYNSDMREFAPNAFLTAPVWNWGPLYAKIAREVKDGTWKSESIWWGMKEELVQLAPADDVRTGGDPAGCHADVDFNGVRSVKLAAVLLTDPLHVFYRLNFHSLISLFVLL